MKSKTMVKKEISRGKSLTQGILMSSFVSVIKYSDKTNLTEKGSRLRHIVAGTSGEPADSHVVSTVRMQGLMVARAQPTLFLFTQSKTQAQLGIDLTTSTNLVSTILHRYAWRLKPPQVCLEAHRSGDCHVKDSYEFDPMKKNHKLK